MDNSRVEAYLKEKGCKQPIHYLQESSATVPLAARALGVEEAMIAKSLSFDIKGECAIVVMCGTARVDNKKFKAAFGVKAKMLPLEETLLRTGHPVGGVCPFAVNEGVVVYLDESLKDFERFYPAAGTPNSAIEMTCEEIERITGAAWVDVAQSHNENA